MTLKEFIEELREIAQTEGEQIEVMAIAEDGSEYTPVIAVAKSPGDGVRRVTVA